MALPDDPSLQSEAALVLAREWEVDVPPPVPGSDAWSILVRALQVRIEWLLVNKPQKLMTALYVLDIGEARTAAAMDQPTMADRAYDFAIAILERETQKIETRRRFAEQYGTDGQNAPRLDAPDA